MFCFSLRTGREPRWCFPWVWSSRFLSPATAACALVPAVGRAVADPRRRADAVSGETENADLCLLHGCLVPSASYPCLRRTSRPVSAVALRTAVALCLAVSWAVPCGAGGSAGSCPGSPRCHSLLSGQSCSVFSKQWPVNSQNQKDVGKGKKDQNRPWGKILKSEAGLKGQVRTCSYF